MAEEIIRKYGAEWRKKYRAVGVGLGFKIVGGRITDEESIVFYVTKKMSPSELSTRKIPMIPRTIKGFKTDVVEVPEGFKTRQDDGRYRPITGGISGSNFRERATGTLGFVNVDGEILSNNHVLACGNTNLVKIAEKGDPIIQPGYHGGGEYPRDVVASLSRWVTIHVRGGESDCPIANATLNTLNKILRLLGRSGELKYVRVEPPANLVDAAAAISTTDYEPNNIVDIGSVGGVGKIGLGDKVLKRGRTTLLTMGRVVAVSVEVEVSGYAGNSSALFTDQIAIYSLEEGKPFSQPGDSGSCIVGEDRSIVGLLFAGGTDSRGNDVTLANKIEHVASLLEYRLS